jgi:non-heme chloroperoxidase
MQPTRVTTPDGVAIAAYEWGNPRGPEILFVHGFSQSHLSWLRQVTDAGLATAFHMVTYDLRGHGASDKPMDKQSYAADQLWADDLATVIGATRLKRPLLVGWSYAGRVIADYLRTYGATELAGINYVDAGCSTDSELFGPELRLLNRGMQSDDLAVNIGATRRFLRACFEQQPSSDDFETMLAFNMVVPARVRAHISGSTSDTTEALSQLTCPVLVTHGKKDPLILPTMGEFIAATVKGANLSIYDSAGHAPFWEDAPRFNAELAQFARSA